MKATLADRFWTHVDMSGECWTWTAYKAKDGYGRIGRGGKFGQKALAHRVSWEIHNGSIPEGMLIDHICHNRACVNPDHLRLANPKQNAENLRGANHDSLTGVRGVTWDKENRKFRAMVMHNYHQVHVGRFETLEAAAEAARLKRLELFTHSDLDQLPAEALSNTARCAQRPAP